MFRTETKQKHTERFLYGTIFNDPIRRDTNPVGGGVNTDILKRITDMESELRLLKQSVATETDYGLAKITESSAVTEKDSGLVLSARERNPAVDGTLANKIKKSEIKAKTIEFSLTTEADGAGIWYAEINLATLPGFPKEYVAIIPQIAIQNSWWHKMAVCAVSGTMFRINSLSQERQVHLCYATVLYK